MSTHAYSAGFADSRRAGAPLPFWSMTAETARRAVAGEAKAATGRDAAGRARPRWVIRAISWLRIIGRQFISPIVLILMVAGLIAAAVGDDIDGLIIFGIVVCSALLGAWQEGHAADAIAELLAQVAVVVRVHRNGEELEVPTDEVRPGDELNLSAGDLVPGDCLLLDSNDVTVDESALTGESFPVSKRAGTVLDAASPLGKRENSLFAGTHVVSGAGTALVMLTGPRTTFGHVTSALTHHPQATSFELGVRRFGLLLLRIMLVLVVVILVINLVLHRPLADSLLFALALAVGITPQMLPAVVSVSLAAGARRLARNRVIVKRLDVIENLGAMSVLCSDKTGTITAGAVGVDRVMNAAGEASSAVALLATLNAGLQTGYRNPLDEAILARNPLPSGAERLGEVPYDFERKRLSVLARLDGVPTLICKGAFTSVVSCCETVVTPDGQASLGEWSARLQGLVGQLGRDGFRVIAVATRVMPEGTAPAASDETGLAFAGLLAFRDPVKPDAGASIAKLEQRNVAVKVVSGDSREVTGALAGPLGLRPGVVTGEQLGNADDAELHELVTGHDLFAEVEPMHKLLIVNALKKAGETVGFLGDGINDAAALHAADVGISVDTAVAVAKEAAAIVLLEKDLAVTATGVSLGRLTFANTLKYIRVAASANFGNILSMVIAAAVLPFLPMLPAQILLLNFMSDIPNTLVSRDRVDPERLQQSGTWDMRAVTRFMLAFGALSTVFDLICFAVLIWIFGAGEQTFHTGWFIESALTQFAAMMTLRTARSAWRSRPDRVFALAGCGVAAATVAIVYSPAREALAFAQPAPTLILALLGVVLGYALSNELLKRLIGFGDRHGSS